jgi:8-oxo-dGTP diphosphatase
VDFEGRGRRQAVIGGRLAACVSADGSTGPRVHVALLSSPVGVTYEPGILARGPWQRDQVAAHWREDSFEPDADQSAEADRAIAELEDRGSPAHDGLAARLSSFAAEPGALRLELQPMRWSLRLGANAEGSLSVLCVARDARGRWLAGRRAPWVATWPGRWALGAGGSVELGEDPVEALTRELGEEWSVRPARLAVEALVALPTGMVMLVGQAWLPAGAQVERDAEHDDHAWWPPDPGAWPDEADPVLRHMGVLLGS